MAPGRRPSLDADQDDGGWVEDLRRGGGATAETEALHRAADQCSGAFAYWADRQDLLPEARDFVSLVDCAALCKLTADFAMRQADYAAELRDLCLQQCQDLADLLATHPQDAILVACGEALRDACDALSSPWEPLEGLPP